MAFFCTTVNFIIQELKSFKIAQFFFASGYLVRGLREIQNREVFFRIYRKEYN